MTEQTPDDVENSSATCSVSAASDGLAVPAIDVCRSMRLYGRQPVLRIALDWSTSPNGEACEFTGLTDGLSRSSVSPRCAFPGRDAVAQTDRDCVRACHQARRQGLAYARDDLTRVARRQFADSQVPRRRTWRRCARPARSGDLCLRAALYSVCFHGQLLLNGEDAHMLPSLGATVVHRLPCSNGRRNQRYFALPIPSPLPRSTTARTDADAARRHPRSTGANATRSAAVPPASTVGDAEHGVRLLGIGVRIRRQVRLPARALRYCSPPHGASPSLDRIAALWPHRRDPRLIAFPKTASRNAC